jgi:hypothetical protein
MKTKKPAFPPGWDEERILAVIAHYENQTDDERAAEIEAAIQAERRTTSKKKNVANGAVVQRKSDSAKARSSRAKRKRRTS